MAGCGTTRADKDCLTVGQGLGQGPADHCEMEQPESRPTAHFNMHTSLARLPLRIGTVPGPHPPPRTSLPVSASCPRTGGLAESSTPARFRGLPDIPRAVGCFCTIWEEAIAVLQGLRVQQHPELDLKIRKARKTTKHQGPPDLGVRRLLARSLLQLKFFAVFKRNSWLERIPELSPQHLARRPRLLAFQNPQWAQAANKLPSRTADAKPMPGRRGRPASRCR